MSPPVVPLTAAQMGSFHYPLRPTFSSVLAAAKMASVSPVVLPVLQFPIVVTTFHAAQQKQHLEHSRHSINDPPPHFTQVLLARQCSLKAKNQRGRRLRRCASNFKRQKTPPQKKKKKKYVSDEAKYIKEPKLAQKKNAFHWGATGREGYS